MGEELFIRFANCIMPKINKTLMTSPFEDKTSPLVSVIMPAFNREHSLSESIRSVISQTYSNWELLIVDDRSTDATANVIRSHSELDKRICYLKNEYTQGPAGARNFGIAHAKGEYLSFLDSDDAWLPHHLNDSMTVLVVENKVFCSSKWYEKKGNEIKPSVFIGSIDFMMKSFPESKRESNCHLFKPEIVEYLLTLDFYPFHISTVVINKSVLVTTGRFDERLFGPEDSDLLFRVVFNYGLCIINDFHSVWVQGEDNIHFFKNNSSDFEHQTVPKILKNRLNHVKFCELQIQFIQKNRYRLTNPDKLINMKRYEVAYNCYFLSRLCRKRNLCLYLKLKWKIQAYRLSTSPSVLHSKATEWSNLKRTRVLFERLPRVEISELLFFMKRPFPSENILSAKNRQFWLYLERDVVFRSENERLLLINRKSRIQWLVRRVPEKLRNLKAAPVIIGYQDLYDRRMRRFLIEMDRRHFGGLVDMTNTSVPIPLVNTNSQGPSWM
jgi:glycosyltransferase involved in cell wall biosynthesis